MAVRKVLLTGGIVRRLMRAHKKTISGLARSMGVTQKRVREVRGKGEDSPLKARDWIEAITGRDPGALKNFDPVFEMAAPGIEKAGELIRSRARGARKKRNARPRKARRNLDVDDIVSFWLEYADAQDFSRAAMRAGEKAITDDPEHWASAGMSKLADHIDAWRAGRGSEGNPKRGRRRGRAGGARNPLDGPVIGNNVLAIEYRGGEGKKKGSRWRHDFSKAGAKVIGLRDGSVLIKRGKRPLWRYFD